MTMPLYRAHIPRTIVLMGCGGIGARIAAVLPRLRQCPVREIWFVDPDTVEARNVARQHFAASDIGRPKAEVLAARYARPDVRTSAYVARGEAVVRDRRESQAMVICAVDTRSARRTILDMCFRHWGQCQIIDVACGETWGHLTYSGPCTLAEDRGHYVTTVGAMATPDIYDPESPDDPAPSCGENAPGQTTVLNVAAAAHAVALLDMILTGQYLVSCAWVFGPLSLRTVPAAVTNNVYVIPEPVTPVRPDAHYTICGAPIDLVRRAWPSNKPAPSQAGSRQMRRVTARR